MEPSGVVVFPELFLQDHEDKLVILDEIHRAPEIFQTLRGLVDQGRRKGLRTGRFLILGSASIDLLRQSGESLAGRIEYVNMGPLTALEVEDSSAARNRLWLRGGFPDAYLANTDANSFRLRQSFIQTYLERDVAQFGPSHSGRNPTPFLDHVGPQPGRFAERLPARQRIVDQRAGTRHGKLLSGDERYPLADGIEAIGVRLLAQEFGGSRLSQQWRTLKRRTVWSVCAMAKRPSLLPQPTL